MRIQHNIAAMSAYRNYTNNTSAVAKNLEKLSSGYKINRAGDDAAGLAISEKMRAQISGLEAAQKNAKDGISLVQTAEGALTEVHDMLNRMVTLATQSANGTYDNETDRAQLQKEMDQLKAEIDRIADSSNFNGIQLLDGSMDTGVDEVSLSGATNVSVTHIADGQMVDKQPTPGKYTIDFSQAKIENTSDSDKTLSFTLTDDITVDITVGAHGTLSDSALANAIADALKADTTNYTNGALNVTYNSGANTANFDVSVDGNKLVLQMQEAPDVKFDTKMSAYFNNQFDPTDGTFTVTGEQLQVTPEVEAISKASREYAQGSFELKYADVKDGSAIKIGDTTYVFAVGANSRYKDLDNVVDLTEYSSIKATDMGVVSQRLAQAAANNTNFYVGSDLTTGVIKLTEKEGGVDYSKNNLAGTDNLGYLNGGGGTANDGKNAAWAGLVQKGMASVTNNSTGTALTLQIGDTSDSYNQLKVSISDCHTSAMGLDNVSIATQESAAAALDAIKSAVNYVSDVRGTLGATQNRLEHTINNLSVMTENIQDAESTIRDTDIAEEMMAYTKNNILVQSAQAMLAQANQIPQGVLQLLG